MLGLPVGDAFVITLVATIAIAGIRNTQFDIFIVDVYSCQHSCLDQGVRILEKNSRCPRFYDILEALELNFFFMKDVRET